jgi:hypothetical protein
MSLVESSIVCIKEEISELNLSISSMTINVASERLELLTFKNPEFGSVVSVFVKNW